MASPNYCMFGQNVSYADPKTFTMGEGESVGVERVGECGGADPKY